MSSEVNLAIVTNIMQHTYHVFDFKLNWRQVLLIEELSSSLAAEVKINSINFCLFLVIDQRHYFY